MSANQRRSGFRLPWLSETEESGEAEASARAAQTPPTAAEPVVEPATEAGDTNGRSPDAAATAPSGTTGAAASSGTAGTGSPTSDEAPAPDPGSAPATSEPAAAAAEPPSTKSEEPPSEFLRDLIGAMRKVADEARQHGVETLKSDAEGAVRALEADAERRRQELRERAEADINGVGEWARAEAERIKAEAEQRVAARRAQLEQQLSAEGTRTEAESKALRARVDEYERELEAYHAQLSEISDPASFAAAAKRMPAPPDLRPGGAEPPAAEAPVGAAPTAGAGGEAAEPAPATEAASEVHPAEEEVLAARLAELDEKLGVESASSEGTEPTADAAPVTTDIVVKGLGSFGAITGFRQSLSGQPGISAVALSLGQSGEFVFRATHAPGFDVAATIATMEGDNATVEARPEGGLHVTLERSR